MNKKKRWTALLLAGCMALALTACRSDGTEDKGDPTAPPSQTPSPAPGAALTVCLADEPRSLDPAWNTAADGASVLGHLFEGLMRWEAQDRALADGVNAAQLVPGAAERYEKTAGEDGVVYTFHLAKDGKWSDGKPVTAQDFVYAWQRMVTPSTGSECAYLLECVVNASDVLSGAKEPAELAVQAVDDYTFAVTLREDTPRFLELCAQNATFPVRQDVVEAGAGSWSYAPETCVGNGPYRLERWTRTGELVLKRSESYHGAQTGPETITFVFSTDQAAIAEAFQAGRLDFARLSGDWAADEELSAQSLPYGAVNYLTFQTTKAPFDDPLVRQAFALAIDREELLEKVTAGGQTPAGALVPPGIDGWAAENFRDQGGDLLDPGASASQTNRDRARELMAQAGHPDGAGMGEVEYLYNVNPAHKAVAEALRDMWQETLGVTVTLKEEEWGGYLQALHSGQFHLARGRWRADYNDPAEFLELWQTGNDGGYESADYQSLLDQVARTEDSAVRTRLLHRAEALLVGKDWALAPLYFESRGYVCKEDWQGIAYIPSGVFSFAQANQD